ncbi:hypothetical protein ACFYV5_30855 [Streptomyces sp. NPDC003035]|uniref:hypothetical protein n=1 Tax=Streptomyces sp. NPDC003035 TaxID=3364676 RepID=UPI0036C9DDFD
MPAAAVVALAYLPYILDSDGSVLGYLGGYVDEEGYGDAGSGSRYALLRLVLPGSGALPVLLVVLLGVCVYVIARGDPERPWSGALLVTGTAFLLLTPGYSWYALLLVALVALDGRGEWLLAAAAVLTGALLRRRKSSVPAATSGPAAATEGGKESNRPPTPKAWDS